MPRGGALTISPATLIDGLSNKWDIIIDAPIEWAYMKRGKLGSIHFNNEEKSL